MLFEIFQAKGFREVDAAPCFFVMERLNANCYVNDSTVYAYTKKLDVLQTRSSSRFKVENIGIPENVLGTTFYCNADDNLGLEQ